MSIALGGCLKGTPVAYGLTADTGGHITYVLGAAIALAERSDIAAVDIVTRLIDDDALGSAYAVPCERITDKLNVHRIDSGNRAYLSKEAAAGDRPAFIAALLDHLARVPVRPDVVHAHFADAGDVAIAIRERFGIPFIYTAHSLAIDKRDAGDGDGNAAALAARIAEEGRIIAAADAIIASSRDEAERQLMHYPGADPARIHRIAPGAALDAAGGDPARARTLVAPFLRHPERPMVLAIARPVAKKNLTGLVDLFAADEGLRDTANLVILAGLRDGPGSGEPEQRAVIAGLIERLDRHDLYGTLALPKRHTREDVLGCYALARETGGVFVNPAFAEPYGLTLTEAAQHGLPVIATANGGAADIVTSIGHGRIADPRDPAAFAAAIHALLSDRQAWNRASAAARTNAGDLTWDGYAAGFVTVVRPLVKSAASAASRQAPERLLVCDIDNTLTGCRRGAAELQDYLAGRPDLAFAVATGRSLQEATWLLGKWGYPDPDLLITSVGSEIYWRENGRLHRDEAFATQIADGWDAGLVERRLALLAGVEPQRAVEQRRFKRSYFARGAAVTEVRARLADLPVHIIHSHGDLLDVLPARAGKGAAMTWAAQRLGLEPGAVIAAGDSGNDLDMLTQCRNPILVANHAEELAPLRHAATTYLARRPHAGGVVEGLRVLAKRNRA